MTSYGISICERSAIWVLMQRQILIRDKYTDEKEITFIGIRRDITVIEILR